MKSSLIVKIFLLIFTFSMCSLHSFADNYINSLSQIHVEKPFDNSYRLDLYFKDRFKGNAFVQQPQNGIFYVYIPDTIMSSKNVKMVYKGNVSQSDVKVRIEEQPYIKENSDSKYVKLSVNTPINSDIQLLSKTFISQNEEGKTGGSFMSIYSIIVTLLLAIITALSVSIFRTLRKINTNTNVNTYTTFPSEFLNSPIEYTKQTAQDNFIEYNSQIGDEKPIPRITSNNFRCFSLPTQKDESVSSQMNTISQKVNSIPESTKIVKSKTTNPIKKNNTAFEEVSELDIPKAEDVLNTQNTENKQTVTKTEENYRPELISEFKIADNKGFYLTMVSQNTFALFGYIGEKVFFLQKFNDLTQVNLQARFYANKNGRDLYVIRLDSYKAMLMVSDTEIRELAVI